MTDREKVTTGSNDRAVDETIAGTGPGILDDALLPEQDDLPKPPSDEEVSRIATKLGVPLSGEHGGTTIMTETAQ